MNIKIFGYSLKIAAAILGMSGSFILNRDLLKKLIEIVAKEAI